MKQSEVLQVPIDWKIAVAPNEKRKLSFEYKIKSENELKEIAHWLQIQDVISLNCTMTLERHNTKKISLNIELKAEIIQNCVRSLEDIHENVSFSVDHIFDQNFDEADLKEEEEISFENISYWDGKNLDLGSLMLEELLLHMNPYPKKDEAPIENIEQIETSSQVSENPKRNPFEVLKKLKN